MKVLFLDIDGVLNSMEFFAAQQPTKQLCEVDPKAVKRIQRVVNATGAVTVLSSTWRHVPDLIEKLIQAGVPVSHNPDWATPSLPEGATERHGEIRAWLRDWAEKHGPVERFAIIDDDADAGAHPDVKPFFVKTHAKYGLYGKHERRLIELLGPRPPGYPFLP